MRYRLLQNMPGYNAGTEFVPVNGRWQIYADYKEIVHPYIEVLLNSKTIDARWFEPVTDEPTRWRAEYKETYYYIDIDTFEVHFKEDFSSQANWDDLRYNNGNYFRTEKQAQAVADFIKESLEAIHNPVADSSFSKAYELSVAARQAVQED